jgi:aryl-alcohol dehydrogenase-like predicted oxidoreductase
MPAAPIAKSSGQFQLGGDTPVNRLGFGTLRITGQGAWGEPQNRDEAIRLLKRLPDRGVDFIDTADSYGPFRQRGPDRRGPDRRGPGAL